MNNQKKDFYDGPRYKTNKILLGLIGQWPYQTKSDRVFFFIVTFLSSASLLVVQIRKVVVDKDDTTVIIESVPPFIVHLGCVIKVTVCIVNGDKLHRLLKMIKNDWDAPMGEEEKVLAEFSNDGRTFTLAYTGFLYCSMCVFLIIPFTPRFIVAAGWANFSTAIHFAIPVDYFVDSEENLFFIQCHLCITIFFMITIYIAVDSMFVVFVQHASGIFSAIGYRLEHLTDKSDLDFDLHVEIANDTTYWIVVDCIKKHKAAIDFVDTLDGMYSGAFLFLVLFNVPVMSFTGLQVIYGWDNPPEAFRQAMLTICELLHLFFECFFSQRLTNHSLRIYESLLRTPWYMTTMRTKKLLNFMMMRSAEPVELRAGNIYTMSMENFSSVVRTSLSYFTLLLSM